MACLLLTVDLPVFGRWRKPRRCAQRDRGSASGGRQSRACWTVPAASASPRARCASYTWSG